MFLSKIFKNFSTQKYITIDKSQINNKLYKFINSKVIPGTDISKEDFWENFIKFANELAPENRDILKKRETLQLKIDEWHKNNPNNTGLDSYKNFLKKIGYLVEEKGDRKSVV